MPISGFLSHSSAGWPSIFYLFGALGTVWSIAFIIFCYESPQTHPRINPHEKAYITAELWGKADVSSPPIPWASILKSMPFWAIMAAHIGQNYGYETLMTELPTFMKQVLKFNIKSVSIYYIFRGVCGLQPKIFIVVQRYVSIISLLLPSN